jgi:hypothetical protein
MRAQCPPDRKLIPSWRQPKWDFVILGGSAFGGSEPRRQQARPPGIVQGYLEARLERLRAERLAAKLRALGITPNEQ